MKKGLLVLLLFLVALSDAWAVDEVPEVVFSPGYGKLDFVTGTSSPCIYSSPSNFGENDPDGSMFGALIFQSRPNSPRPILFATGVQEQMRIAANGNVGIGLSNPSTKLHIQYPVGGVGFKLTATDGNTYVTSGNWGFGANARGFVAGYSAGNNDAAWVIQGGDGISYINCNRVGIGTNNPQSKLAVNGTITATEIKVTSEGWADFVFDDDYQLRSLASVAAYIEKNNHLPDVPSGAEIKQGGIEVSEMLAKQMQKIEELTLYVIELKQANDSLKDQNQKLMTHKTESDARYDALAERLTSIENKL